MSVWDLNRLRYEIRKITGKYDTSQLPDTSIGEPSISNPTGIDDYINDFYLYDMPEHMRSLRLRNFYTFTTIPNCGTYAVPQSIMQIYDPAYVDNYQIAYHQWPDIFYNIWPELDFIDRNLFTPNGALKSFTFKLTQTPVQQGTVVIGLQPNVDGSNFASMETFTDKDTPIPLDLPSSQLFTQGTLTGNQGGTGTVDYLTGSCTITYKTAPPSGALPSCHYHPYVASRPRDILFWQQQIFVRPIPNDTYQVKVMAYMLPTTVMSSATNATVRPSFDSSGNLQAFSGNSGSVATDLPQFNEFWQLIAYGASIKIFISDGEHQEAELYKKYFEETKLLVQRKALKQLAMQRIETVYSNANRGAANGWPLYPLYTPCIIVMFILYSLFFNIGVITCEDVQDVKKMKIKYLFQKEIFIAENAENCIWKKH